MITCEIKSIYRIICEILLRIFYKIRTYFGQQGESIPMSFVLGFYVSLVVKRWWEQYRLLPWPDTLALFISAAIPNSNGGVNVIIYQQTYIKTLVYSKKIEKMFRCVFKQNSKLISNKRKLAIYWRVAIMGFRTLSTV